jgi:transposase
MLTREDDVDAHALHRQGWTISAIAKHLGHDRKTIRAYLAGERASSHPDPLGPYLAYATQRLVEAESLGVV